MNKLINTCIAYGHQFNPVIREYFQDADFANLTDVQEQMLIASYQQMMAPQHEALCRAIHNRDPWFDGEPGPASDALVELQRCACKDYLPLDMKATGTGSWRAGCLADYPNIHAVYYHLDDSRMPARTKGWWDEIVQMVHNAYDEVGMLLVKTENKSQAQLLLSFEVLAGSVIGLAQLPPLSQSAICDRGYFCKLDPGYAPSALQVATLWAHEFGHNMGSGHISGDPIMHPSIQSGWSRSFKGTTFGNRLDKWFGGQRTGGTPTPGPTPGPGPGNIFTGKIKNNSTNKDYVVTVSAIEV